MEFVCIICKTTQPKELVTPLSSGSWRCTDTLACMARLDAPPTARETRSTRELETEAERLLRHVARDRLPVDAGAVAKMLDLVREAHEAGRQSVHDDQKRIADQIVGELASEPPDDRAVVFLDLPPVRRLLAEYHQNLEHRLCASLRDQDLWVSEAADLPERIAGQS